MSKPCLAFVAFLLPVFKKNKKFQFLCNLPAADERGSSNNLRMFWKNKPIAVSLNSLPALEFPLLLVCASCR